MITLLWAFAALGILVFVAYRLVNARGKPPDIGTEAPSFTLNSQENKPVSLGDFKGKWIVLYFYPKDFTSGCTVEAHNFQRDLAEYEKRDAVILGVSTQDEKSHQEFCTKEGLNFKLLADTKAEVSNKYASAINVGVLKFSSRHTFLIDPSGLIKQVWLKVDVQQHSAEVLRAIDTAQRPAAAAD